MSEPADASGKSGSGSGATRKPPPSPRWWALPRSASRAPSLFVLAVRTKNSQINICFGKISFFPTMKSGSEGGGGRDLLERGRGGGGEGVQGGTSPKKTT